MDTMRRLFSFTKNVAAPEESWDIQAVTSDDTLDRENEVIEPQGWILDPYLMNPVVLAYHQHRLATGNSPVVGSAPKTFVDAEGQLQQFIGFAAREPNATALGTEFRNLYRGRHMRAFSVGFSPLEGGSKTTSSGSGKSTQIYHHTKQELLEVSCVPVGANPNALARIAKALASGLDDEALARLADLVMARLKAPLAEAVQSAIRNPQSAIENVERQIAELIAKTGEVSDLLAALAPDTLGPDVGGAGGGTEGRPAAPAADPVPEAARRLAATLNP